MSIRLSKKQTAVVDFISDFIEEHGFSPSMRDIQEGLGLKSVSAVAEHVDNLEVVDTSYPETTQLFRERIPRVSAEQREVLERAAVILGLELEEPGGVDAAMAGDSAEAV